jgi:hypothetical protein
LADITALLISSPPHSEIDPIRFILDGLITLIILSGAYVIYSKKDNKFVEYFRIALYIILGILVYIFLDNNIFYSSYHFYTELMGYKPQEAFYVIFTGFDFMYILMVSAILLLNKPVNHKIFKIGKIKVTS